ncbi:MAG: trigger factor [Candidatus Levybacteria bacterium]|nr:trigger factor [Candidatus Levybacteria bacterium]
MISAITKEKDGTIKLTITIPSYEVVKTKNEVVEGMIQNTTLPGFRKGKAPRKLVEEKLDKAAIQEEVLKKLLPKFYVDAVSENKLKPIINPKIHVDKFEDLSTLSEQSESKGWTFTALTCEAPNIELGSYKENVKKINAKSKIIVPGKEPFDVAQGKPEKPKSEETIKALLDSVNCQIPKILIDQEVDRSLSQLLDEVKKLGLNLDQYLASTGKTPESVRKDYEQKAENDIKFEFALQQIADKENITVDQKEVDEAINKAKDDQERKNLEANRYLLTSILRQQKTLDFLRDL